MNRTKDYRKKNIWMFKWGHGCCFETDVPNWEPYRCTLTATKEWSERLQNKKIKHIKNHNLTSLSFCTVLEWEWTQNRKKLVLFVFSDTVCLIMPHAGKLNWCKIEKMSKHSNHAGIILNYVPTVSTFCFAKLPACLVSLAISIRYINTVNQLGAHPLTLAQTHTLNTNTH